MCLGQFWLVCVSIVFFVPVLKASDCKKSLPKQGSCFQAEVLTKKCLLHHPIGIKNFHSFDTDLSVSDAFSLQKQMAVYKSYIRDLEPYVECLREILGQQHEETAVWFSRRGASIDRQATTTLKSCMHRASARGKKKIPIKAYRLHDLCTLLHRRAGVYPAEGHVITRKIKKNVRKMSARKDKDLGELLSAFQLISLANWFWDESAALMSKQKDSPLPTLLSMMPLEELSLHFTSQTVRDALVKLKQNKSCARFFKVWDALCDVACIEDHDQQVPSLYKQVFSADLEAGCETRICLHCQHCAIAQTALTQACTFLKDFIDLMGIIYSSVATVTLRHLHIHSIPSLVNVEPQAKNFSRESVLEAYELVLESVNKIGEYSIVETITLLDQYFDRLCRAVRVPLYKESGFGGQELNRWIKQHWDSVSNVIGVVVITLSQYGSTKR